MIEQGPKNEKLILTFKELNKNDVGLVGGKGANLGEMYNAGFPVPPGFVVSAKMYKQFIEETSIKTEMQEILQNLNVDDNAALQSASNQIKTIIRTELMPEYMQTSIKNAYEDMYLSRYEIPSAAASLINSSREPPFVAVRSSATAEDLPTASFAGQQETFLNIKGYKNVTEAVKDCWASLFTPRAIFYREKNNFDHFKVLIAVVIQKMVDANKAGVVFSADPVSGDRNRIIIEGAFGLGEAVVSGSVNPDRYIVEKDNMKMIDKRLTAKDFMIKRDPMGKNIKIYLDEPKRSSQVLSDEEVMAIARAAKLIENHYDFPQDIEWAIEGLKLYIVQSRPITTLGEKQEQSVPEQNKSEVLPSKEVAVHTAEPFHATHTGALITRGLPASRGTATGPVKIISSPEEISRIEEGDILVTKMTDPDYVPAMKKAGGIITDEGGMTSHAAIVSREMGIPCIVGTTNATKLLKDGQIVTLKADQGEVFSAEALKEHFEVKQESIPEAVPAEVVNKEIEAVQEHTEPVRQSPPPETETKIYMNLGIPEMIDRYVNLPFDGIGLMRLEFIIADDIKEHPLKMIREGRAQEYIDKIADGIMSVAKKITPKPIIVRFSDFKTNEYNNLIGGAEFEPKESNPMIGWRGVSRYVSGNFEPAFRLECKAIKKVRNLGMTNVHVMLPFVRNVHEVKQAIKIIESEGLKRNEDFQIWIMAEVPSVAIIPEEFAKLDIDGASIGSNDLTQLTLGVDRDSELLNNMKYFDERNGAVLHAIKRIIQGFLKHNKSISLCGQAPSEYPEYADFLVMSGITSISVNPDVVDSVRRRVAEVESKTKFMKIASEEEEL